MSFPSLSLFFPPMVAERIVKLQMVMSIVRAGGGGGGGAWCSSNLGNGDDGNGW